MSLPKQKKDESDTDYAARLAAARESARKYREANKEVRREYTRKWKQANKEATTEYNRKWQEANKEKQLKYREARKEMKREYDRKYNEAKTLASAKGRPLRADFRRARRPRLLTELLLKVAEDFCRNYGFPLDNKWDSDVLKHAAQTIRNSPELDGAANPWYGTDYLCPGVVNAKGWSTRVRRNWRNKL